MRIYFVKTFGSYMSGSQAIIHLSGSEGAWSGTRALELLLGEGSAYMRDILTEELAKGLDAYWRLSADDALDAVRARLTSALGVRAPSTRMFFLPQG